MNKLKPVLSGQDLAGPDKSGALPGQSYLVNGHSKPSWTMALGLTLPGSRFSSTLVLTDLTIGCPGWLINLPGPRWPCAGRTLTLNVLVIY